MTDRTRGDWLADLADSVNQLTEPAPPTLTLIRTERRTA